MSALTANAPTANAPTANAPTTSAPATSAPVTGAPDDAAPLRMAFRDWFGLTPTEAEVLTALYQAGGAPLKPVELARRAGSAPGAISVHLVEIRRALDAEAIDHLPRAGYCLTGPGLDECRAAILTIANALRGCA